MFVTLIKMGVYMDKTNSVELDFDQIPESDIQFDCPHCNKHLSIDPRGAGLVIVCPDCEKHVSVPIPEGLEIEDIDATPEELSFRLRTSKTTITKLQQQILSLQQQVEELQKINEETLSHVAEVTAQQKLFKSNFAQIAKLGKQLEEAITEISLKVPELND